MRFIGFDDNDSVSYLLAIAAGILTFSIPLVWNFYKNVLDLQEKTIGDSSEHILTKYVYKDMYRNFELFVLIPIAFLAFLSLFIAPFFGFVFGYVCLGAMFLYALWLPWIFGEVKRKSSKNLKELILSNQLIFKDYKKILYELWGKHDREIEKDSFLSLEMTDLFESLKRRVEILFVKDVEKLKKTFELLEDFNNSLEKRNIFFFFTIRSNVLVRILNWHFRSWKGEYTNLGQEEKTNLYICYSDISGKLDDIIIGVMRRTFSDGHLYSFLKCLEGHLLSYKNSRIGRYVYLDSIPIYEDFFKNVENSKESYSMWKHYFPKEWKVTKDNVKNHSLAIVWSNKFFDWANNRIESSSVKFDRALDGVMRGLFPEVNPVKWSLLMAYLSLSWGDSRMQTLIEWKKNFGLSPDIFVSHGHGDIESKFEKHIKKSNENTYELAVLLFGDWLKNDIDANIEELERLKGEYKDGREKDNRRREVLEMFKGIKTYMQQK